MENYKLTKAIRFKLEAQDETIPLIKNDIEEIKNKNQFQLVAFTADLNTYFSDLENYLFYQKKNKDFAIKDKLNIKRKWLRQYAKQELANFNKKKESEPKPNNKKIGEQLKIESFEGLSKKIESAFKEAKNICANLAEDSVKELNERAKRAKTGLVLQQLKTQLPFLISLVESSNDKNEKGDLSVTLKDKGRKLEKNLLLGIKQFLPAQSGGLTIAKASFNYYTLNKKPIEYFDERINYLRSSLQIDVNNLQSLKSYYKKANKDQVNLNLFNKIIEEIKNQLTDDAVLLFGEALVLEIKNFVSLRQILKNIKSTQKKIFNEEISKGLTYQDLKQNGLYLFKDIEEVEFNDYKTLTDKITVKSSEVNNANGEEKKELTSDLIAIKKERGKLINGADKTTKEKFKTYKEFANFYRYISQKHGGILSKLKGIEKEKVESQMLKYWSLIFEENGGHKLVLIPKEKAIDLKKLITKQGESQNSPTKLFWFESLTFRSLRKLCFGNLDLDEKEQYSAERFNSFYPEIIKELSDKIYCAKEYELKTKSGEGFKKTNIKGKFIKGEYELTDAGKIAFYKDVLKSNYAKSVLEIPFQIIKREIINSNFKTLDDFQIALEKICYQRFANCDDNILEILRKEYKAQIFDITSLDLQNSQNIKEKAEKWLHQDKNHTQIWKDFWNINNEQNFAIRLNPEITITYRQPKESRIKKYGEGSKLYDPKKKNRYLHPQSTLITTISENCISPTKDLSFLSDDGFEKSVKEFNEKLNKESVKFAFGIDNGEVELSTLGVYLPDLGEGNNNEKIAKLENIKKYGFEVLTIKDLTYKETDKNRKERKIIQNPSYFLKKENYLRTFGKSEDEYEKMFAQQFEKKYSLTLDLTSAKVICGHIVTNGDVVALLNLWLRHAQRNIYEMNDHIKKETAKKVIIKNQLNDAEKLKLLEHISDEKEFQKLGQGEKNQYSKWVFEDRSKNNFTHEENKKFKNCQKKKGNYLSDILFACSVISGSNEVVEARHIFKNRAEFFHLKSKEEIRAEIDRFNTNTTSHNISNEELDMKILDLKISLVANAIGVIDFLYKQYKQRFVGEGLIVKEGFGTSKVLDDLEKFSGNIYRILERKLYQKFQNYGLVPPIKSLLSVRTEGNSENKDIWRLGNIAFVDQSGTSQECPVCIEGKLKHTTNCPKKCGFDSQNIMHSNDGIAGFNIAKRGLENLQNPQQ
jgi:hypothetical protein